MGGELLEIIFSFYASLFTNGSYLLEDGLTFNWCIGKFLSTYGSPNNFINDYFTSVDSLFGYGYEAYDVYVFAPLLTLITAIILIILLFKLFKWIFSLVFKLFRAR